MGIITPGSDYLLNDDGSRIIFTEEKCRSGCYHTVYIHNIETGKLHTNIVIRSGQILRVDFDRDFSRAAINNMHMQLKTFDLKSTR